MKPALAVLTTVLVAASVIIVAAVVLEPTDAQARGSYDGEVKACDGKMVYLKPAEKRVLWLHNRERAERDMQRLCVQQQLQKAARKHSADMIRKNYFDHDSQNGTAFNQRVKRAGYTPEDMSVYRAGENIAWGSDSKRGPANIHENLMNSDVHRENILDDGFRKVGIAVANGKFTDSRDGETYDEARMYTMNFGYRRR